MGREDGPFWGNGMAGDITGLPRTKGAYPMEVVGGIRLEEFRTTERRLRADGRSPSSGWQLSGAGSVGGQVLVGLPTLWRIRNHPALRDRCRVWPFELQAPLDEPGVTLAEIYPSLLEDDPTLHDVRDARQVLALVDGYRQMAADGDLAGAFDLPDLDASASAAVAQEEGWILPVSRDRSRARTPSRPAAPAIPRGLPAARAAAARVLRDEPMPWWHEVHWQATVDADGGTSFAPQPPPVLRLHGEGVAGEGEAGEGVAGQGEAGAFVFTEQDRRRAVADGRYQTLLRSLLATRTVLYLGDSFSDPHIARLRADVADLLGNDRQREAPLGYAVLPDVPPALADHHRAHEGIEVPVDAEGLSDALLAEAGHDAQLCRAVAGRTILWVDPAERGNGPGIMRLRDVGDALLLVGGPSEARTVLRSRPVDLVVTHWGDREGGRRWARRSSPTSARRATPVRRWSSRGATTPTRAGRGRWPLGATDHVWSWPALFREIARVLAPSPRTPFDLAPRLDG